MAGSRIPGTLTDLMPDGSRMRLDDGTSALWPMPAPGPLGMDPRPRHVVEASLDDVWRLDGQAVARNVWEALRLAVQRVPRRLSERTGLMLDAVLGAVLPTLLAAFGVLAAATALGAFIGGLVGFFAGGVSAVPGAALGGDAGFAIANAMLAWAGLGFLIVEIAAGLPEMGRLAQRGVRRAAARSFVHPDTRPMQQSAATDDLADAFALLVCLVLQGIVAWLLKNPAIAAARSATASVGDAAGAIRAGEASAAADAAVAELVGHLRASRFGEGFAAWVEGHWRELVDNPRLQPRQTAALGTTAAAVQDGAARNAEKAVTPSQLRSGGSEPASTTAASESPKSTAPKVTKTISPASSVSDRTISFSEKQLQKKFESHAGDFGMTRSWGKGAAEEFQAALSAHVADAGTQPIAGTYRGTQKVTHFFNPQTGLNVMRDTDGAFLSGWKLSTDQIRNLLLHGNIQ